MLGVQSLGPITPRRVAEEAAETVSLGGKYPSEQPRGSLPTEGDCGRKPAPSDASSVGAAGDLEREETSEGVRIRARLPATVAARYARFALGARMGAG